MSVNFLSCALFSAFVKYLPFEFCSLEPCTQSISCTDFCLQRPTNTFLSYPYREVLCRVRVDRTFSRRVQRSKEEATTACTASATLRTVAYRRLVLPLAMMTSQGWHQLYNFCFKLKPQQNIFWYRQILFMHDFLLLSIEQHRLDPNSSTLK